MATTDNKQTEPIILTPHIVRPAQGIDTSQSPQLAGVVERDAFVYLSNWINGIIKVKVSPDTLRATVGVIPGLGTALGAYDLVCDIVDLGTHNAAENKWGFEIVGNWISTTIDVVGLAPALGGAVKGFKPALRMMIDPRFTLQHLRDHLVAVGQGEALVWLEQMVDEKLKTYPSLVDKELKSKVGGLQGKINDFAKDPKVKFVNSIFSVFGPTPVERVNGLLDKVKSNGGDFVGYVVFGGQGFKGMIFYGKQLLSKGRSHGAVPGNQPPRPKPKSENEAKVVPHNAAPNHPNTAVVPQTEQASGRHHIVAGPSSDRSPGDCGCQAKAPQNKPVKTNHPVYIATGEEVLYHGDFASPGLVPVQFVRCYRSSHVHYDDGPLGARWTTPYTTAISEKGAELIYHDAQGRNVRMPALAVGEAHVEAFEDFMLRRESAEELTLVYRNGDTDRFRRQGGAGGRVRYVLFRKESTAGPALHILTPIEARLRLRDRPLAAHLDPKALLVITDGHSLWLECHPADDSHFTAHSPAARQALGELDALHRANQQAGLAYIGDGHGVSATAYRQALANKIGRVDQLLPDASRHTHVRYTYAPALGPNGQLRPGILELVGQADALDHARHYAYTQLPPQGAYPGGCHLLQRYTDYSADGKGFGQNLEWQGNATWVPHGTGPDHPFATRCVRTVADDGTEDTRLTYRTERFETEVTDAVGNVNVYHYNGQYLICGLETRYPDGSATYGQRLWNRAGQPIKDIDPEGRTTLFAYDERGNLTAVTDATGSTTRYEYDAANNLIKIVDPTGQVWQRQYDAQGNLAAQTDPAGNTTAYAYDSLGQLIGVTDAKGGKKALHYNDAGQLIAHTDCSGKTTRYSYNALGHLIASTDAAGHVTRYNTDCLGRVSTVLRPDGSKENYTYDAADRLTTVTDPLGRVTRLGYNAQGLPTARIDAKGQTLSYGYDAAMRLVSLTNQNGERTDFTYDAQGNLVREVGFDGKATTYTYDLAGQLIESRDGKNTIVYERDGLGRLLKKTATRAGSPKTQTTTYRYDALGRLVAAENAHAKLAYAYDDAGNLIEETQRLSVKRGGHKVERVFTLKHEVDPLGNRLATTLPNGRRVDTQRYGSGHWIGTLWNGTPLVDLERDDLHRETVRLLGTQQKDRLTRTSAYDPLSRLTRLRLTGARHDILAGRNHAYDAVGNLTRIDDQQRGALQYDYDPLGQLIKAVQPGLTETFAFDPAGNLTDGTPQGKGPLANTAGKDHERWEEGLDHLAEQPKFETAPKISPVTHNLLKRYLNESYEHDADGNTIRKVHKGKEGEQPYTLNLHYDAENRLVKAIRPQGNLEADYLYDPFGRRIAKTVKILKAQATGTHNAAHTAIESETTTLFVWDGDTMVQEIHPEKTVSYLYEPESFVPLAQVISDTPETVYDPQAVEARKSKEREQENRAAQEAENLKWLEATDQTAYELAKQAIEKRERQESEAQRLIQDNEARTDRIYYINTDHLGTPQEVVSDDGKVVWLARYKAWGRIHQLEKEALRQPLRFQGQYEDEETGLYYNRYRYYDPDTVRYLTQDPIGLQGGENLYSYVPSSTAWIDPLGLWKGQPRTPNGRFGKGTDPNKPPPLAKDCNALHGNDLDNNRPAIGYSLRDRTTGEVLKYGETTNGKERYSQTYLEKENALFVPEASGTKREMHCWQHRKILEYKAAHGGQRPRLNKSDY